MTMYPHEPQLVNPRAYGKTDRLGRVEVLVPTFNIYGQRSGHTVKKMSQREYARYSAEQSRKAHGLPPTDYPKTVHKPKKRKTRRRR